jgi:hypothetical protein
MMPHASRKDAARQNKKRKVRLNKLSAFSIGVKDAI